MSARSKLNRVGIGIAGLTIVTLLILFHFVHPGEAAIFSYKDDKGAIHFTDDISKIPEEFRESGEGFRKHKESRGTHRTTPAPFTPEPIETPGNSSTDEEVQIPLIPVSGGNFLVDILLNGRIKARLMLDTGASFITLSEEIGQKLGVVSSGAEMPFNTAGGEEWMPLVALQTVSAGEANSQLVEASIAKHIKDIDGLLGMSFLGDYRFEIDRENKVLILKPMAEGEMEWGGKTGSWWKKRFELYNKFIRDYSRGAKQLRRNHDPRAKEYKNLAEYYKDVKMKLENHARVSGVPERFR